MIVLGASTVTELLVGGSFADEIQHDLAERSDSLAVPYLLDVEVIASCRSRLADRHSFLIFEHS